MAQLRYRDAGVDIEAGDRLVDRIKPFAARTRTAETMGGVGGFAGLCRVPEDVPDPVLVSGTDGVGTKLRIAFAMGIHDTIGVDLVAMCVNDIVTVGARPLFFLDCLSMGHLDVDCGEQVIKGVAHGCEQAGCALLGGETAELPGFYSDDTPYDLVGFAVGVVSRSQIIDGSHVKAGDTILGLPSSGLHSNGYSLVRKALLEQAAMSLDDQVDELGEALGASLLRPTRIYADAVRAAVDAGGVRALCHITGGGLAGNLPRVLPDGLGAQLHPTTWTRPPIFDLVQRVGDVAEPEMQRTFNLGIGFALVVSPQARNQVRNALRNAGETPVEIGVVQPMPEAGEQDRVWFESS